jgi:hypothetical protein
MVRAAIGAVRRLEVAMKYALLIYDDQQAWGELDEQTRAGIYEEYGKFAAGLTEKDQMRGGEELQPTTTATTVRLKDGKVLTTDGPYAETKEQLGGFFLIECDSLDEALEAAVAMPSLKHGGTVEVRPVAEDQPHD